MNIEWLSALFWHGHDFVIVMLNFDDSFHTWLNALFWHDEHDFINLGFDSINTWLMTVDSKKYCFDSIKTLLKAAFWHQTGLA